MRKSIAVFVILLLLLLNSCAIDDPITFIGKRHQPILFDGTRIYGGMGTDILSYVSTLSGTYGPLCTNPTCTHSITEQSCEARSTITINAFTLTNDNDIIVSGRDREDPSTYSAILIDTETGKHKYILKQNPNNINAMLVINETLYFLSQIDDGDSNEGEHVVCYVPLRGGKVQIIELPKNDYYFAGADTKHLYLNSTYDRSILAVDYNNDYIYNTLYVFSEGESTDCFIYNDTIYTYTNRTQTNITPINNTGETLDTETISKEYTLFSLKKTIISSGEILNTSTVQFQSTTWGVISDNYIYLPHFSPTIDFVRENTNGKTPYPIHTNPGIDIIDINSMNLCETIEIPNVNIIAIIHADEDKIIFYCNSYQGSLSYYMGWYDRKSATINKYRVDWNL